MNVVFHLVTVVHYRLWEPESLFFTT